MFKTDCLYYNLANGSNITATSPFYISDSNVINYYFTPINNKFIQDETLSSHPIYYRLCLAEEQLLKKVEKRNFPKHNFPTDSISPNYQFLNEQVHSFLECNHIIFKTIHT